MDPLTSSVDLSMIPLAPNPNGDPPNFINPPSLAPTFLGVGISFITLSVISVSIRIFTYLKAVGKLHLDDYLCLFGLIGGVAYWSLAYSLGAQGTARHSWDVPAILLNASFLKRQTAAQVISAPTVWAVKTSMLAFYIRVFENVRWLRITCYTFIGLAVPFYWSNVVLPFIFCIPYNGAQWDTALFAKCAQTAPATLVIGAFTVVIDIALFVIPIPVLAKLNLSATTKRGLFPVFLAGFLILITSVIGLAYRVIITTNKSSDPLWDGNNVSITAFVEVFGTVIISCTPSVSAFWHKYMSSGRLSHNFSHMLTRPNKPKGESGEDPLCIPSDHHLVQESNEYAGIHAMNKSIAISQMNSRRDEAAWASV
ncbi:hypothetical protein NPX13_g1439 [Xylaria arbuscula]|uniref:Rhodopsin domain-containing protein n=1 Tax=Xylaria arbuscula TaxID=114810 RepID=A0A9W8NLP0_9PEZI|nr:hypothetical protein NPX13_g1439 [Xylaria arbuscula]